MQRRLPKGSCDSHLHVFGNAEDYPVGNPNTLYRPPEDCTLAAIAALHAEMGIERAVFVQPTAYGTDHRLLYDTLSKPESKNTYRGVAIVDDSVSDAELQRLDAVGVRGARFNFGGRFKLAPDISGFRRTLGRIGELGWYAKVFGLGDDLLAVESELRGIKTPAMIDHVGGVDYRRGKSQPVVRLILDLLAKDNWWVGLSNADLRSSEGPPWNDAAEFGKMFYQAAPERSVWGTDWPHVHRFIAHDEAGHAEKIDAGYEFERFALLERFVPDEHALEKVLVENPARFFGFS